jgi:hypothetical protein
MSRRYEFPVWRESGTSVVGRNVPPSHDPAVWDRTNDALGKGFFMSEDKQTFAILGEANW